MGCESREREKERTPMNSVRFSHFGCEKRIEFIGVEYDEEDERHVGCDVVGEGGDGEIRAASWRN